MPNKIEYEGKLGERARVIFNFDFSAEIAAKRYSPVALDAAAEPAYVGKTAWAQADIDAYRAGTILQRLQTLQPKKQVIVGADKNYYVITTETDLKTWLAAQYTIERTNALKRNQATYAGVNTYKLGADDVWQ
ncbi:MAG: hypothetical protein ACE5FA_06285 [Dehalococcoidia bacterium]